VLWVLALQLALMMLLILPLVWKKLGLWIVHGGLLLLLVGGYITQVRAVESQLSLAEGETGHFTTAYQDWELAAWQTRGDTNDVVAYVDDDLRKGASLDLAPHPARLTVNTYYENAVAFTSMATGGAMPYLTASGIAAMESRKPEKEATQNAPGVTATLHVPGAPDREILLYGLESKPLALTLGGERVYLQLRRRHYPLDFSLKLNDFVRTLHPGTDVAKSYESYAELKDGPSSRPVKVWMNNPLRYKGYTFFQASFVIDQEGEHSTFAVVTNPGRLIPYISSLMVFGGMLLHFFLHFLGYVRRTARP
jgi:cytochrome c biogenesis protein ResB